MLFSSLAYSNTGTERKSTTRTKDTKPGVNVKHNNKLKPVKNVHTSDNLAKVRDAMKATKLGKIKIIECTLAGSRGYLSFLS